MISSSHITYYHLCHRKLWLHHHGMRMEDNSQAVAEGQLIGKSTYTRRPQRWKELELGFLKIDHYDPQTNTVREVKKSPKLEHAHVAQVKYYLYALEKRGVHGTRGLIEYPKHRRTTEVPPLTDADRREIQAWEAEVLRIVSLPQCPPLVKKSYCRSCAFRDFCFV
ncbi:MAG: CRISPR-associated protein Cas4 [Gammaproteobacteria bacterium]|nr:MAG: CRISPR-associated protein Cas4 [Gammaproteobacteria bacterium]